MVENPSWEDNNVDFDWRSLVEEKKWSSIDLNIHKLAIEDLRLLRTILEGIVPRREWGDGLVKFDDFIGREHATSFEMHFAAQLLHSVKRNLDRADNAVRNKVADGPFYQAVSSAKAVLEGYGLKLESRWSDTHVYWSLQHERWRSISPRRVRALEAMMLRDTGWDNRDLPSHFLKVTHEELVEEQKQVTRWLWEFSWRTNLPITKSIGDRFFEHSSREWHASHILNSYYHYFDGFDERINQPLTRRFDVAQELLEAAEVGYNIGEHFAALERKQYDPHALRGIGTRESARAGGEKRGQALKERRDQILFEMQKRVDSGLTISRAAELTAKRGMGKSAGANRQLWTRHKRQK